MSIFFILFCNFFFYCTFISQGAEQQENVVGYQSGIKVSNYIGEGYDKTSENLRNIQGFFSGISTSHIIGEEESNIKQPIVFNDVKTISDISSLLTFDLISFMNQSSGRSDALDIYQEELANQKEKVDKRLDILTQQIISLNESYKNFSDQGNSLEANIFSSINMREASNSEERLQQFITLKSKTGELYTRWQIFQTMQQKYKLAQTLIANKLLFITANRDALIKGVRVVDIPDPNIQLIFSQQEWEQIR